MNKWLKWGLVIGVLGVFSYAMYLIIEALGITDLELLQEIVNTTGVWGWVVFITIAVSITTLLCFVPMTSATFIGLSVVLFGPFKGFLISLISIFLSSSLMFLLGRFGGKLASKLVGEESLNKARELIGMKSITLLPMMFLFPVFPDDALCVVVGMSKMRYWYFALIVFIFRGIGIASICLGINFISVSSLTVMDYIILINLIIIDVMFIFKMQPKNRKLNKK